jgi:hypothetical protein
MQDVFLAIQSKIRANVPAIRFIDFDLGQLEMDMPGVSYPALLVGLGDPGVWQSLGNRVQKGDIVINIRLAFKVHEKTHSVNSSTPQTEALSHLTTAGLVNKHLSGLEGAAFTKLSRIGFNHEKRGDYRVYSYSYVSTYYDETVSILDNYTNWHALNPNLFPDDGIGLGVSPDLIPMSIGQNLSNLYIEMNDSNNYHETLSINGELIIDGLLTEI